jgi:hypothetical protein
MKQIMVAVLSILLPFTVLADGGYRVSCGGGSVPETDRTSVDLYI